MSGSVGDVVAVLRQILNDLDGAAVNAKDAQKQAANGLQHYETATEGADSNHATTALARASEAAAKSGKVARLIAEAATEISEYANRIAPGSVPSRTSEIGGMPSGEKLLADSTGKGSRSSKLMGRVHQVRSADDGFQHLKKLAETFQDAAGGSGGVAVSRPVEPVLRPTHPPGTSAGDALIAAITIALVGIKGAEVASRIWQTARVDKKESKG
ncbi:hypothetical protein [Micromonospora sp. NBC_01813]|uniref:hypothetical protein n=1 Tax=Micromonospora sp. NBC_01813 TaxID=2975988 RepID=UPI002DDBB09E|nr:hypothetical protein [Micromonospora sp. NBC_01813]WSA08654.1 hypothetical protein OG958_31520 [Micromonospora sp. NBC_01813]